MFGSWGPMILGHAYPAVVEAIREAAGRGASFGASHTGEGDLAELVMRCFPSIERLRFVSSGTEACMSAIRLARGYTGRKFVVKFEGCYHGHSDAMLVKAGSGIATLGIPGSAGVPEETAMHTLALPYNDLGAVQAAFDAHPGQIACIIVEPVVGNAGTIPPATGYLHGLRKLATEHGALLIFDEVMTGFRVSLGGAQQIYGITPDLTTLGKIIGGGLPCAAFGGRTEIMDLLAPLGPVYQAGTLSGNPLAMAAGIATLRELIDRQGEIYSHLERTTAAIADGVAEPRQTGRSRDDHEPGRLNVHLVLHRAAGNRLRQRSNLGSRPVWPLPPRHDGRRSLAATKPVRSSLRKHRARRARGRTATGCRVERAPSLSYADA